MTVCRRLQADEAQIQRCRLFLEQQRDFIEHATRLYTLLGSAARLQILLALCQEGELCPCDLADSLRSSVSAVSQHLRKLKDGGIVQVRREGQTLWYSLKPPYHQWIPQLIAHTQQLTASTEEISDENPNPHFVE